MNTQSYQVSNNHRMVSDSISGKTMVYHTLYGNPRVISSEGLRFLNLFRNPVTLSDVIMQCDEDPRPIIDDFASAYFLIAPGFDEKKYLLEQRTSHIESLNKGQTVDRMGLAISDSCNFSCPHCLHFQRDNSNGSKLPVYKRPAKQLNMNWETAKKCIDQYVSLMQRQGRTLCKIHFGNAEPLINWLLIAKVLEYCDKIKNLAFEYTINTNLVLMTREIALTLKRYNVRIATSLDGMSQANNAIRVTAKGQGTFDKIVEKVDHAFCAAVTGKSLEFNVDGSIKVCSHSTTTVGHIDEFSLVFNKAGKLDELVQKRFPGTEDLCSGCVIEGPCGGQCHVTREVVLRSESEKQKGLLLNLCDFYRRMTDTLIKDYLRSDSTPLT